MNSNTNENLSLSSTLLKLTKPGKHSGEENLHFCEAGIFYPTGSDDTPTPTPSTRIVLTKEFKKTLKALVKFAAKSDVRYYLNGILFSKEAIVATDGHRLLKTLNGSQSIEGYNIDRDIIISREVIEQLFKLDIWNNTTTLDIDASKRDYDISIQLHDGLLVCSSIDGKYPDYERIINRPSGGSNNFPTEFSLKKEDYKAIKDSIKIEKHLTSGYGTGVQNGVKLNSEGLTLPSGAVVDGLKVTSFQKDLILGYNYKYLLDYPIGEFSSQSTTPANDSIYFCNEEFEGVLMPMRM